MGSAVLTPIVLGIVSAVLIAIGFGLVWRDMRRGRPVAAKAPPERGEAAATPTRAPPPPPQQPAPVTTARTARPKPYVGDDPTARMTLNTGHGMPPPGLEDAVAVTIVHRTAPPPPQAAAFDRASGLRADASAGSDSPAFDQLRSAIATISSEAVADDTGGGAEGQRWPNVEKRWLSISTDLDDAVTEVNKVLAPVGLLIGPVGESGWSFKNRGYGNFRRVLLNGRSIAWLRTELTNTGQLFFKTRAHAVEQALLNATAQVKADGATARVLLDGFSKAIRPSAEYAAWTKPRQQAEAEAGQDGWSEIAPLAKEALGVAATAFREAGADIVELSQPAWDATSARHRWQLAMLVGGRQIGLVNVDLVRRALEVTVDERDRQDLARRQAIDTQGLTAYALAEVIANCAWPTVAQALQTSASAAAAPRQ